jgi:hypothetical protein
VKNIYKTLLKENRKTPTHSKYNGKSLEIVVEICLMVADIIFYTVGIHNLCPGFYTAAVLLKRRIICNGKTVNAPDLSPESFIFK